MADKDLKIKTITGKTETIRPTEVNRTSTFLKLAGAAIGSYYLSKQAPEEFEGFTKEIKRQQDVSDTDASDQAKAAAGTIGALLTKNALDRDKRVNGNLETIDVLVGIGLNSKYAALAAKKGMGKELLAIRKKYPQLDLNKLYQGIDDANVVNYSNKDLAKLISGRPTKANIDYSKFKSTSSGIEKLFGYNSSKNLQETIQRSVESQDTTQKDELDYTKGADRMSKYGLTDLGYSMLANKDQKLETKSKTRQNIASSTEGYLGVEIGLLSDGGYNYTSGSKTNNLIHERITNVLSNLVAAEIQKNLNSKKPNPELTPSIIRRRLIDKYFKYEEVGGKIVDKVITKANGDFLINDVTPAGTKPLIPKGWQKGQIATGTGDGKTKVPLTKAQKVRQAQKDYEKKLVDIDNLNITDALKRAKKRAAKIDKNKKIEEINELPD